MKFHLTGYRKQLVIDDFIINDRHYYWMSISDMEKDANIIQKNLEVVDFVKENA